MTIPPDRFSAADYYTRRDEPDLTPADVLAGFPEDTALRIEQAQKTLRLADSTIALHKVDGIYSETRQALHEAIISKILSEDRVKAATPRPGQRPTFIMLGGRGGSGKSWFKEKVYQPERCIVLDADVIKKELPEYEGWNAFLLHEESSELFDRLTDFALALGLNLVHDATLKTTDKAVALISRVKAAGYRVEVHYMYLSRKAAAVRAIARFLGDTGRLVPPSVILSNTGNEASFDAVKASADAWSFRDNDVPPGQPPKLVSENLG
ncbi:MAG: zeta toxin family protein [Alphaproteobacteria bacterium]